MRDFSIKSIAAFKSLKAAEVYCHHLLVFERELLLNVKFLNEVNWRIQIFEGSRSVLPSLACI